MRSTQKYPLAEIAHVVRGVTFSRTEGESAPFEGALPVIRAGNVQDRLILSDDLVWVPSGKISKKQIIKKNDLVMCTSSGSAAIVGKCARAESDWIGSFGAFCVGIRTKEKVCDSGYLFHFLRSPAFRNWSKKSGGANIKNIRKSELEEFEIPLPPLPEQRRIAAILDKADTIRRKRQQAIRLIEEFLRSVFLDMFGDPVTNPKGWEVDELGHSLLDARNGMSRRGKPGENVGQVVLRLQDVRAGEIRLVEPNRVPLESVEKERYLLKPGDIAFIRVNGNKNYVGRSAIFVGSDEPIYYNDHIIRLRYNDSYNPEFLTRVFNSNQGKILVSKQIKTSAGQYTINQGGIAKMMMIKPPRGLQDKFSRIVKQGTESLESFLSSNNELENLFNSLVQRSFRGEL